MEWRAINNSIEYMSKIRDFIRNLRCFLICCKKTMDVADDAHEAADVVIDEILKNIDAYVIDEADNKL